MIRALSFLSVVASFFATPTLAQTSGSVGKEAQTPNLVFELNNHAMQRSLYPELYLEQSVDDDMSWVRLNDSGLQQFWDSLGQTTLTTLAQLSGISWKEQTIECRLLRYYPTIGLEDPLVMPIGGIRNESVIMSVPPTKMLPMNLIFLLSKRLLATAPDRGDVDLSNFVAHHPLLEDGPYRRDLMAQLLTLSVSQRIFGAPQTDSAAHMASWQAQFSGWKVFEQFVWNKWQLTPEKPLVAWLLNEPYDGSLVNATRQVSDEIDLALAEAGKTAHIPPMGKFGMALKIDAGNKLIVNELDASKVAAVCGIKIGDQIVSIGGQKPPSLKEGMELMLSGFDKGGAKLSLLREGKSVVLILRQIAQTATKKTAK